MSSAAILLDALRAKHMSFPSNVDNRASSVDPDQTGRLMMSRLLWLYTVCKFNYFHLLSVDDPGVRKTSKYKQMASKFQSKSMLFCH